MQCKITVSFTLRIDRYVRGRESCGRFKLVIEKLVLSRFDTLRRVKREVQKEERWLDGACGRLSAKENTLFFVLSVD